VPKRKQTLPNELRASTEVEFLLAKEQERDDHSPPPDTPTASYGSSILAHQDRWNCWSVAEARQFLAVATKAPAQMAAWCFLALDSARGSQNSRD
jgi:hypothetical protein